MEITRDREKRTVCIKMTGKIDEMSQKFAEDFTRKVDVPMPTSGFVIKEERFDVLFAVM